MKRHYPSSDTTTKRTINGKGVLILLVSTVCLGILVHVVHGIQVKRNAGELLDTAQEAVDKGETKEAVKQLDQYVKLKPDDNEAQARLGLLMAKDAKDFKAKWNAYQALDKALRNDQNRHDLRMEMARIAVQIHRFPDAKEHLEILQKKNPEDGELDRLQALCQAGESKWDQADFWLSRAIIHQPDQVENHMLRAEVLRRYRKKPDDADNVVRSMLAKNERSVPMRLAAGRYFEQNSLWDDAEKNIQYTLKELNSHDVDVFLLAADVERLSKKDKEGGRKYLEQGLEFHPEDTRLLLAMAGLEIFQGRRNEALSYLRRGLEKPPTDPEYLARLATMLMDVGEVDKAQDLLVPLTDRGEGPLAESFRARILAIKGDWGKARILLETNAPLIRNSQWAKKAYLLLAECQEILRNPDGEMKAFRQVLTLDPTTIQAQVGLASLQAKFGKRDDAIERYKKVLPQVPAVGIQLANLLIMKNQTVPKEERQWGEVEEVLDNLPSAVKGTALAQVARATLLEAKDKSKEAVRLLDEERLRRPKELPVWMALAALYYRQGKLDSAFKTLDEAEKSEHAGKRPELMLSRIVFTLKQDNAQARKSLQNLEPYLEAYKAEEKLNLVRGLAEAYQKLGDKEAALRCWRRVAERRGNDLTVRLQLLDAAFASQDAGEMQRLLNEIKPLEGEGGPLWNYGEAARLVLQVKDRETDAKLLDQALKHLTVAREQRPNWSQVALLEGHILRLQGQFDQALERYKRAIEELGERDPGIVRTTVDMLYQRRRFEDAQALLNKLPEQTVANSSELERRMAELTLINSDRENPNLKALEQARHAVPADSKNPKEWVWLGQMNMTAKQPVEAEKCFRKALELSDKGPENWVTLILFLARQDPKKAEAALEEARRRLPKDVLPQVLAPGYEALGQMDKAKDQYDDLLKTKPNDPIILYNVANFYARSGQAQTAETYLRQLAEPATKAPKGVQAWARRQIALTLADTSDYRKFQEALSLLEINLQEQGIAPDDERARALVLATQPSRRREAIELFERLNKAQNLRAGEQFRLAQLYEAAGEWPKARSQFRTLATGKIKNPFYVSYFAQRMIDRGELAGAEVLVRELEAMDPKSWRTAAVKAHLLKKQGKLDAAIKVVRELHTDHPDQFLQVANAYEELGAPGEAEAELRQFVAQSKRPERGLPLALFLGRRKRTAEAMELCEELWNNLPPEMVATACLTILRTGSPTPGNFQTVERHLDKALQQKQGSPALIRAQAQLYEIRGQYSQAIDLYQRVLQREPNDALTLNNLAYYLTFQETKGQEALALMTKAIDLAGPMAELLDTRAMIHLALHQPEAALKDLGDAIDQQQNNPTYYLHQSMAHLLAKDRGSALASLQKAKDSKLDPDTLHPLEKQQYMRLLADLR